MAFSTNLIFYCIIIIILLAIGLYTYYKYNYISTNSDYIALINNPTQFKGDYETHINLADTITDRTTLLKDGTGYGITIMLEMYLSNNTGNMGWGSSFTLMKPIINLDDNLILSYNPSKGRLYIIVKFINALGEVVITEIDLGVVPMQKWSKHAIILNENKIIYIRDGILVYSKTINYIPIISGMNVILGKRNNNFYGKIRSLTLVPRPLNINEVS